MVFSDRITPGEWLKPGGVLRRLAKRLLQVAVTLFGLLILTFIIGRVMPIDPVLAIVGQDADQSTYQQVYQQLGLDKPLYVQFWIYFNALLHGDLGNALLTGRPVIDDIIRVFPATIELATMAIIVGAGLGCRWACWRRQGAANGRTMSCVLLAWPVIPPRSFGWG